MTDPTRHGEQRPEDERPPDMDLLSPELLRLVAVWSVIPAYLGAGALVGYFLDRWLGTYPVLIGVMLVIGLGLAVRDMLRLRREFERGHRHAE